MDYFLLAVSTRQNLDLCRKHCLAGFPSTENGAWAWADIREGDFISFLYGAKVHDLYKVTSKVAVESPEGGILPPWPPLEFKASGKKVGFPFRLNLERIRDIEEPIAREQFSYVAENLLQRGGYWKSHFQADLTTLENVSRMGKPTVRTCESLDFVATVRFEPRWSRSKRGNPPTEFRFRELLLQSLIRRRLKDPAILSEFLSSIGFQKFANDGPVEILGEKALPEGGLIDILLRKAHSVGTTSQIVIEVKLGSAGAKDEAQIGRYLHSLGTECEGGIIICRKGPRQTGNRNVRYVEYDLRGLDLRVPNRLVDFESHLRLEPLL